MPYAGMELSFYEECMRTIPAIALMKQERRPTDVLGALDALMATGTELKLEPVRRWSILCAAYMAWAQSLFESSAAGQDCPPEEFMRRAVASATAWMAADHA